MGKSLALRFMTFMMAFGIGSRTAWLLGPQAGTPGWLFSEQLMMRIMMVTLDSCWGGCLEWAPMKWRLRRFELRVACGSLEISDGYERLH